MALTSVRAGDDLRTHTDSTATVVGVGAVRTIVADGAVRLGDAAAVSGVRVTGSSITAFIGGGADLGVATDAFTRMTLVS